MPQDTQHAWLYDQTITITLNALADGSMRQSQTQSFFTRGGLLLVSYKIRVGATPTDGGRIEFYLGKEHLDIPDGGVTGGDSSYTGSKAELFFLAGQRVDNTANAWYEGSFYVREELVSRVQKTNNPWVLVVANETGYSLYADNNHIVHYMLSLRKIIT